MDEFTIFIIVVALGFHLVLTFSIIVYICYKDCTCSCPKRRKNVTEEELERSVDSDENTTEQLDTEDSNSVGRRTDQTRVNVFFTNRWVSSLTNRIQAYASRRRSNDPESIPTVVITGGVYSDDDDDSYLPCYNEALALEMDTVKSSVVSLDFPPSYEDIFSKIQQTRL